MVTEPAALPAGGGPAGAHPRPRRPPVRLLVALATAALLGGYLMYASLIAGSERAVGPSLLRGSGDTVYLGGKVVEGSARGDAERAEGLTFQLADEATGAVATVHYPGSLPAGFESQRVMVKGVDRQPGSFEADRGSMTTRCPSKFKSARPGDGQA